MSKIKVYIQGNARLTAEEIDTFFHLLDQYTSDSNIVGNVTSDIAYQDAVDALHERFPQMNFDVLEYYIRFADPEVLRVLLSHGVGDGTGITKEQFEGVSWGIDYYGYSNWFKNNITIKTFDELVLNMDERLPAEMFSGCINLESVNIKGKKNITREGVFFNCVKLRIVDFSDITTYSRPGYQLMQGSAIEIANFMNLSSRASGITKGANNLVFACFPKASSLYSEVRNASVVGDVIADYGVNTKFTEQTYNRSFFGNNAVHILRNPVPSIAGGCNASGTVFFVPSGSMSAYIENFANVGYSVPSSWIFEIGGSKWIEIMRYAANKYAKKYAGWTDEQISNSDYSDPYIDYRIFGLEPPTE